MYVIVHQIILWFLVKKAPVLSPKEARSFLKSKHYLLSTPNVVSLGFISEKVDGKRTGGKIFRVGVLEKISKENIKEPDIFVPKYLELVKINNDEVVHIPVKVVEEGMARPLLTSDREANPGNDAPYKGASLVKVAPLQDTGCLGANAQYQGLYRLLSAAHVLTKYDRDHIGNDILVQNNDGSYVNIGARVTGQIDVVLYETPTEQAPVYSKQDLAWGDITEHLGSSEILNIGTPTMIRRVREGERVKYYGGYSEERGSNVEVDEIGDSIILEVSFPPADRKYAFFEDVCRINVEDSRLDHGDSGTAIVAEDDNALLGILMAKKNESTYHFCKLELDE